MSNASLIYEGLSNFDDIKGLIGKQEDIFLDFKESRTTNGALLDDDKAHFSKTASGFAHQEGGVLVWGIGARKGEDDVDEAKELKPIGNIRRFLSALNDYIKYSTEPVVDGIQNRLIYESDDENQTEATLSVSFLRVGQSTGPLGTPSTISTADTGEVLCLCQPPTSGHCFLGISHPTWSSE
jgi:hypothetical protein